MFLIVFSSNLVLKLSVFFIQNMEHVKIIHYGFICILSKNKKIYEYKNNKSYLSVIINLHTIPLQADFASLGVPTVHVNLT